MQQEHGKSPKYAIIGLGKQGRKHMEAMSAMSDLHIIDSYAVCDTNSDYIKEISNDLNINGYDSYKELLEKEKPEAVILALPNNVYDEVIDFIVNVSARKPKYILKEKPYAVSLDKAKKYLEMANSKNILLSIAQQRYFAPNYITAKEWVDKKEIGKLLSFEYRYTLNDKKESWYWNKDAGGGCWLNVGWHMIFLLLWFFGDSLDTINVKKFHTTKRAWHYNTDDMVFTYCKYSSGMVGRGYFSVIDPIKENTFKIIGTKGAIYIDANSSLLLNNEGEILEKVETKEMHAYVNQLKEILNIETNRRLASYNMQTMQIIEKHLLENE